MNGRVGNRSEDNLRSTTRNQGPTVFTYSVIKSRLVSMTDLDTLAEIKIFRSVSFPKEYVKQLIVSV